VYSISAVSRMIGVPVPTLRTWEDRYGLVVPQRNISDHRLYSRDQIERLRYVKAQMAEGASAADAHRLLAERMEQGGASPPDADDGRARLLILLAEHDTYAADLQEYFLTTEGFDVEVALDEETARKSFEERSPSLAVVELLISGGVGLELCRWFKERDGAFVVAVSVLAARDPAIEAGADAFLQKPLDPLQLVSTVRDLLGSSALLGSGLEEKS